MFSNIDFKLWLVPTVFIAGGILIGLIGEKIILPLFRKAAEKINLETVILAIRSMRGMGIWWGFLAGITGALTAIPLKPETSKFLSNIPVVLFIFSLTVVLARISVGLFDLHARKGKGDTPTISLFANIIKL